MTESKPFDYWDFFLAECERANAPLYVSIVRGVSGDDGLKRLASHVKPGQPMANILLAAVHFLLLRGADHPLRRFYPNLNGGHRVENEDAFPAFKDFAGKHRAELEPLIANGVTNTNEVARCSALHAGFRTVAKEAGGSLNLIEIGPSAGLNMIWDRYGVNYRRGSELLQPEPTNAELVIECELRGQKTPPVGALPSIASRVGLELNPADLNDAHARDWLKALVWPDNLARFARLEKAIEIFRRQKVEIRGGNALDLLPEAIARIPEDQAVCVYHSYVIYQFSEAMREALSNILTVAGLRRPVFRLGCEGTMLQAGDAHLTLGRYHDGTHEVRRLAVCHPHGAWLEWEA
ncbi:MAG TPA: DUF2332 domain-containing protein [Rhizomicrobium sp.]|jgi:hypothetical protein|nr:DUF2332 domain-containing protein [Rhizomicrobium sp.]